MIKCVFFLGYTNSWVIDNVQLIKYDRLFATGSDAVQDACRSGCRITCLSPLAIRGGGLANDWRRLCPWASRYTPPPGPTPPFGSNPSSLPLLSYAPSSPLPPFIPTRAFWTLQVALPVNHTFRFDSPSTAYTGPIIHCLPPCPFRLSSVLQTSVGSGLIPSAFYTPPALNYPPYPPPHRPLPLPNTLNPTYSDPLVV